jgi:hypothetical protein
MGEEGGDLIFAHAAFKFWEEEIICCTLQRESHTCWIQHRSSQIHTGGEEDLLPLGIGGHCTGMGDCINDSEGEQVTHSA